jgi:hypothetical protein
MQMYLFCGEIRGNCVTVQQNLNGWQNVCHPRTILSGIHGPGSFKSGFPITPSGMTAFSIALNSYENIKALTGFKGEVVICGWGVSSLAHFVNGCLSAF